jgi:hypothetical protein
MTEHIQNGGEKHPMLQRALWAALSCLILFQI